MERACDLPLADWSLVVIEIIKTAHLERTVVRAIPGADAAIVGHYIETVLAVNGGVHRADCFARRVLAVLTRHRLIDNFRILGPNPTVLIKRFIAGEITIDAQPVHYPAMRYL